MNLECAVLAVSAKSTVSQITKMKDKKLCRLTNFHSFLSFINVKKSRHATKKKWKEICKISIVYNYEWEASTKRNNFFKNETFPIISTNHLQQMTLLHTSLHLTLRLCTMTFRTYASMRGHEIIHLIMFHFIQNTSFAWNTVCE